MTDNLKTNNKIIERRLTRLETLMEDVLKEVDEIKKQVFNEIPHQINKLEKELFKYKISIKNWIIGIFVTLLMTLTGTLLNFLR